MTLGGFLLQLLLAVLAVGLFFYLPGRLLLRALRLPLDPWEHLAGALLSGAALLVLVTWLLSWAGMPGAVWAVAMPAAGLEGLLWWRERRRHPVLRHDPDTPLPETLRTHWPVWLLVAAAVLLQGRFMVSSGWVSPEGVHFLAWHAHDAPWHVFNIEQMTRVFPPEMPGFSGKSMQNYHLFSDLLWASLRRLAPLNPWHVYFRLAPVFYSALLVILMFISARAWSRRIRTAYAAVVLAVFTANFGYVMPLLFGPAHYGIWDSIFWVQSPLLNIFNPGVSSAYLFLLMGLWALIRWQRGGSRGWLVLLALAWGVLPGFKVYPGLLAICALALLALVRFGFHRDARPALALGAVLPVFLLVFLPPNLHASSLVKVLPGFNLATMLVAPDRMNLMTAAQLKLWFARYPLLVALLLGVLLVVFVIGNLGVRVAALGPMWTAIRNPRRADPILLWMTFLAGGALIGAVGFVQAGVQWNTIQFFYFAVLIASLPAAAAWWRIADRLSKRARMLLGAAVLALGLPGVVHTLWAVNFTYQVPAERVRLFTWVREHAQPGEVVLRPLPEALWTEAGMREWLHNQERGRMTSMSEWSREAASLAGGDEAAAEPEPSALPAATPVPTTDPRLDGLERDLQTLQEQRERAAQTAEEASRDLLERRAALVRARDRSRDAAAKRDAAARELAVLAAAAPTAVTAAPEAEAETVAENGADTGAAVAAAPDPALEAARTRLDAAAASAMEAKQELSAWERSAADADGAAKRAQASLQRVEASIQEVKRRLTAAETEPVPEPTPTVEPTPEPEPPAAAASAHAGGRLPMGWMDSAFGAALSGHNTFVEDTVSSQIMGFPITERVRAVYDFYHRDDEVEARAFLEKNRIQYVILPAGRALPFAPDGVPLRPVFQTRDGTVYKYIPLKTW